MKSCHWEKSEETGLKMFWWVTTERKQSFYVQMIWMSSYLGRYELCKRKDIFLQPVFYFKKLWYQCNFSLAKPHKRGHWGTSLQDGTILNSAFLPCVLWMCQVVHLITSWGPSWHFLKTLTRFSMPLQLYVAIRQKNCFPLKLHELYLHQGVLGHAYRVQILYLVPSYKA